MNWEQGRRYDITDNRNRQVQNTAVQGKVRRSGECMARQNRLELRPRFQSLHVSAAPSLHTSSARMCMC